MIEITSHCPLCLSADTAHFSRDQLRDYLRCEHCKLVFVPQKFHLSSADEQAQYDLHENNPDDSGYRTFLSRLADPLLERLPANAQGLDFGCGPGPCLSAMLEEQGHSVALYDLYYADNRELLTVDADYDFITATEVIEHLSQPMDELRRLWRLLKPGGYLGLMTKLVADADKFANWHYKIDPTHISFFSVQTFEYLSQQWDSSAEIIGADVIIFRKPL